MLVTDIPTKAVNFKILFIVHDVVVLKIQNHDLSALSLCSGIEIALTYSL